MRIFCFAVGVLGLWSCSSGNRYVEEREGVVCRNPATADQPIEMSYSFVTHRCWDGEKVGKPNQIKTFSGCRVFSKVDGTEKVWRNDAIASGSDCNVTTLEGREVLFQAKDNSYWVTSSESCTFAAYESTTKETENQLIFKSEDGKFEINGEVTEKDGIGDRKIKIATKESFCKTSGTAILEANGAVRHQDPKMFLLTSNDVGTFEDLNPENVYSIAFVNSEACSGIFKN